MKIDERWECRTRCAIKNEGTHRGATRDDTCTHGIIQKIAKGKTLLQSNLMKKDEK